MDSLAKLLDSKYRIPGTQFKFGLDPIIGLIPGAGDLITFLFSSGLIVIMIQQGASGKLAIKMLGNVLLDTLIGSIPILGQIFDFFYKANQRNVKLLREHYEQGKHQGSGIGIIIVVILMVIIILALLVFLISALLSWFIGLF